MRSNGTLIFFYSLRMTKVLFTKKKVLVAYILIYLSYHYYNPVKHNDFVSSMTNPEIKRNLHQLYQYIHQRYQVISTFDDQALGYYVHQNILFISYRGSYSIRQAVLNFNPKLIPHPKGWGKIHQEYYSEYLETKTNVQATIKRLLQSNPKINQIIFTGHSIGGCLAHMACSDLMRELEFPTRPINGAVVAFNTPMFANKQYFECAQTQMYLVQSNQDVIKFLPIGLYPLYVTMPDLQRDIESYHYIEEDLMLSSPMKYTLQEKNIYLPFLLKNHETNHFLPLLIRWYVE